VSEPVPEVIIDVFTVELYEKRVKEDLWELRMTQKIENWGRKLRRIAHFLKTGRALLYYHHEGRITQPKMEDVIPNVSDLNEAEITLVREIQAEHFSEEINILLNLNVRDPDARPELRKQNSLLLSIDPFVDANGILHAGGRLELSTVISFDSKCPMILPCHGEAIESLVCREHELQLHAGVNHTLASLKKFVILGGRTTVRRVTTKLLVKRLSKDQGIRKWHLYR
jgi:hypothetical protein